MLSASSGIFSQRFTFEDNAEAGMAAAAARARPELRPGACVAHLLPLGRLAVLVDADQDVLHAAAAAAARARTRRERTPGARHPWLDAALRARFHQQHPAIRARAPAAAEPAGRARFPDRTAVDGRAAVGGHPLRRARNSAQSASSGLLFVGAGVRAIFGAPLRGRCGIGQADDVRRSARQILAASLAQLGEVEDARNEAQIFLMENPRFSAAEWGRAQPFRRDADREHFIEGYLKAGLPP